MSGKDNSEVADDDLKCCVYLPKYIYDGILFPIGVEQSEDGW